MYKNSPDGTILLHHFFRIPASPVIIVRRSRRETDYLIPINQKSEWCLKYQINITETGLNLNCIMAHIVTSLSKNNENKISIVQLNYIKTDTSTYRLNNKTLIKQNF